MSENNERVRREKRPITLEDVEKHLNQQDAGASRVNRFTVLTLGGSIVLVGVALWIGNLIPSPTIVRGYCVVLWLWGLGLMAWGLYRSLKIKE